VKKLLAMVVATGLLLPLAVGCGDDTSKDKAKPKAGTTTTTPPAGGTTPPKDKGTTTPPVTDKKTDK